jgi:hypothetical protein
MVDICIEGNGFSTTLIMQSGASRFFVFFGATLVASAFVLGISIGESELCTAVKKTLKNRIQIPFQNHFKPNFNGTP